MWGKDRDDFTLVFLKSFVHQPLTAHQLHLLVAISFRLGIKNKYSTTITIIIIKTLNYYEAYNIKKQIKGWIGCC